MNWPDFKNLFAQYSVRPCSLVTARRPLPTTVTWGKFLSSWRQRSPFLSNHLLSMIMMTTITISLPQGVKPSPFRHHDDNYNYFSLSSCPTISFLMPKITFSYLPPSWGCRPSHWICGSSTGLRGACPHNRRLKKGSINNCCSVIRVNWGWHNFLW